MQIFRVQRPNVPPSGNKRMCMMTFELIGHCHSKITIVCHVQRRTNGRRCELLMQLIRCSLTLPSTERSFSRRACRGPHTRSEPHAVGAALLTAVVMLFSRVTRQCACRCEIRSDRSPITYTNPNASRNSTRIDSD